MSPFLFKKKAVILVIVLGILMIISILALAALTLMTQEARIAESKIKRIRALYAAQAGMVNAVENLRRYGAISNISIGAGTVGYPATGIPVTITRIVGAGIDGTDELTINANY